ncbi:MAG: hypothetical protein ACJASX_000303 [Limisphaerales bacterium]|jgi:hypothetical protein
MRLTALIRNHWQTTEDKTSVVALVSMNLIPVFGVFFAGWDAGTIMLVYWAENLVVGFYNILKMALATESPIPVRMFLIGFFTVHYGLFCLVHGVFVLAMGKGMSGGIEIGQLLVGLKTIAVAVIGLMISHGYSFFENFIRRGERARTTTLGQMAAPYGRIVLLHIAILAAGVPVLLLGSPMPLLLILVALKIVIDLVLHRVSHGKGLKSLLEKQVRRRMGR